MQFMCFAFCFYCRELSLRDVTIRLTQLPIFSEMQLLMTSLIGAAVRRVAQTLDTKTNRLAFFVWHSSMPL